MLSSLGPGSTLVWPTSKRHEGFQGLKGMVGGDKGSNDRRMRSHRRVKAQKPLGHGRDIIYMPTLVIVRIGPYCISSSFSANTYSFFSLIFAFIPRLAQFTRLSSSSVLERRRNCGLPCRCLK